ncbi:MAG TPA: TlpA family protein disulfide reductase [Bacteroidetes bacterium]|nr:TlpA family protein disulfide reductase [Bacteroidota bacterium]
MRNLFLLTSMLFLLACKPNDPAPTNRPLSSKPKPSSDTKIWLAQLDLGEKVLPFRFRLETRKNAPFLTLLNASEEIPIPDITQDGDSLIFRFPFFDSEIRAKRSADQLTGIWYNHARTHHNRIPFQAHKCLNDCNREVKDKSVPQIAGDWEVTFVYQSKDSSKALGRFEQEAELLSGTFMTPTGDYRFLEGKVDEAGNMRLSCFDGAHAFLFEASLQADGSLNGGFWSGAHWFESWTATRTYAYKAPSPDSLTRLLPGQETIAFSFPDVDSNIVSLSDARFQGKVVLVEVMGTWCPNCRDETALLHEMYTDLHPEGLEIISLSFELRSDFSYAAKHIRRMKKAFGLQYPVLFAGKAGRKSARVALPMLEHIMSYPTTLFVDRSGKVRRIYTGFSGPATGENYTRLVADFQTFTRKLLAESPG